MASLKEMAEEDVSNIELPAGRPRAWHAMHPVKLVDGAAPGFVPSYRRPQHKEEIERQVDELLKAKSRNRLAHLGIILR